MTKKIDFCPKIKAKPSKVKGHWVVPASWLMEQAAIHLKNSDHNVVFASDGKELWIYGYKPATPKGRPSGPGGEAGFPMAMAFPGATTFWAGVTAGGGEEKRWFEDWPGPIPGGG